MAVSANKFLKMLAQEQPEVYVNIIYFVFCRFNK